MGIISEKYREMINEHLGALRRLTSAEKLLTANEQHFYVTVVNIIGHLKDLGALNATLDASPRPGVQALHNQAMQMQMQTSQPQPVGLMLNPQSLSPAPVLPSNANQDNSMPNVQSHQYRNSQVPNIAQQSSTLTREPQRPPVHNQGTGNNGQAQHAIAQIRRPPVPANPTNRMQPPLLPRPPAGNGRKLLVPAPGARTPIPREPTPDRRAIHQLILKEPLIRILSPNNAPRDPLYCQYVLAYSSIALRSHEKALNNDVEFPFDEFEFNRIAKDSRSGLKHTGPVVRELDQDSMQWRLRCIAVPYKRNGDLTNEEWFGGETKFPTWLYLKYNDQILDVRRKLHYGKDLPIDITPFCRLGNNRLLISLTVEPGDAKVSKYTLALEKVFFMSATQVRECATSNALSAEEVRDRITSTLSSNADEDNDIALLSSTVTVRVRDPISFSFIGTMPVRGEDCKHFDCFELENFLHTRPKQRTQTNPHGLLNIPRDDVTEVDVWKCPICNGDARPHKLRLDNWMLKVREELIGLGMEDADCIMVEADGTWRVDDEEQQQQRKKKKPKDAKPDDGERENEQTSGASTTPVEIIDLSD